MYLRVLAAGLIFVTMMSTEGCTLIGMGLGSLSDRSRANEETVPKWELEKFRSGRFVRLYTEAGDTVVGDFLGLCMADSEEYARRYSEYSHNRLQKNLGAELSYPGRLIRVHDVGDSATGSVFLGFDQRFRDVHPRVRVFPESGPVYSLVLLKPGDFSVTRQRVDVVDSISCNTTLTLSRHQIEAALSENPPPLVTDVLVRDNIGRVEHLHLDQIDRVDAKTIKHGKLIGMIFGAVVDAGFLAIAIGIAASGGIMGGGF
jgi:hypothetical protein